MPAIRSTTTAPRAGVPLNGYYPKLLRGDSGSVWLVTEPKTGVIIFLSGTPQKGKHKVGYRSAKLNEAKMKPHTDPVTLQMNAS